MKKSIPAATGHNANENRSPAGMPRTRKMAKTQAANLKVTASHTMRAGSKLAQVIALLSRKDGASADAIMTATGWQKHSVHGFLAGVVRKKLGLNLVRNNDGEESVYRIVSGGAAAARAGATRKTTPSARPGRKATAHKGGGTIAASGMTAKPQRKAKQKR